MIQWLFWQMAGLGPMAGQNHHFSRYAPEKIPYAITRYVNETNRLYGVLDQRLADRPFVGGADYSIADIACYPWIVPYEAQGQKLEDFPSLERWFEAIRARPATVRAYARAQDYGTQIDDERGSPENPLRADGADPALKMRTPRRAVALTVLAGALVGSGAVGARSPELVAAGATIRIEYPAAPFTSGADPIREWVQRSADIVAAYYARFPAGHLRLVLQERPGEGVHGGQTFADPDALHPRRGGTRGDAR